MQSMYNEEHIIAFLNGSLADEEIYNFEEALKTDKNLAISYAFLSDVVIAEDIWGDNGVMQGLETAWHNTPFANGGTESVASNATTTQKVNSIKSIPKSYFVIGSALGTIMIGAIIYFLFLNTPSNKLSENINAIATQQEKKQTKEKKKISEKEGIAKNSLEKIEEITKKEKKISAEKKKIGNPKNKKQQRYLVELEKQQKFYHNKKIALYDKMIASVNSEVVLPKVDTLIYDNVVFSWDKKYQNENLELEIFTKETQDKPKKIEIKVGSINYQNKFSNDFYYWRLRVKNKKTIGVGRFYVSGTKEKVVDSYTSTIKIPKFNPSNFESNPIIEDEIRNFTDKENKNFHIIYPRNEEILETSIDRIEEKHIFLTFFEWFGNLKGGKYKVEIYKGNNEHPLLQEIFPDSFFTKSSFTQFPVKVRLGLFTPNLYYLKLYHNEGLVYVGKFIVK